MKVLCLQSGSSGNSLYVESGSVRILFDAGISGNQAQLRLQEFGVDIRSVQALVISHDHRDHSCAMGIFQRKFGLPIHITARSFAASRQRHRLGTLPDVAFFAGGAALKFGHVTVETIPTPHDGMDGVAFVVDDGQVRLGIFTDLGHVFDELRGLMSGLDAVVMESNYEPRMLEAGPYPESLKRRISGPRGHLSNQEAAELLLASDPARLKWACLAHLSDENNDPAVALATHRQLGLDSLPLHVAPRYAPSELLEV